MLRRAAAAPLELGRGPRRRARLVGLRGLARLLLARGVDAVEEPPEHDARHERHGRRVDEREVEAADVVLAWAGQERFNVAST